jgi:DeoR/GlpR family transcriptional regulator of sugar metabolism
MTEPECLKKILVYIHRSRVCSLAEIISYTGYSKNKVRKALEELGESDLNLIVKFPATRATASGENTLEEVYAINRNEVSKSARKSELIGALREEEKYRPTNLFS